MTGQKMKRCGCPDHCPECGATFGGPSRRSRPDHNRLFALISKAYLQWNESHEFQPASEEQLRAYLLVRAGHFEVASIPAPDACAEHPPIMQLFRLAVEATAAAMSRKSGYADIRVGAGGVEILTAKSLDYRTVPSQKEFGPIREAVEQLIEMAIGVTAQELLKARAA